MKRRLPVLIFLLCAACPNPHAQAELDTFQAIAPEYRGYVEGDPALTPEAKQLRYDTVETWRRRVGAER